LAAVVLAVYLLTLHPGVGLADSAELQYACPLLGVCHPPGYQIEVTIGYLFSKLPLGRPMAWRINLMMAVCGTIGALALYGTVRRITGQVSAGLVGAGALAFSSMYWAHSTLAEVYVFYGMFLLVALYALQRFIEGNKAPWLYLGAACLGVAVADRSSELFILPAFLLLWWVYRTKIRLTWLRIAAAAVVFVLPFVFTVSSYLVHQDPSRLACRDDAIRDQVLRGEAAFPKTPTAKLISAVRYCLGLKWIENATQPHTELKADAAQYALQLSGLNLLKKDNPRAHSRKLSEGTAGIGMGLPGLILACIATVRRRRLWGWILLGWGIFVGNLVFYLWHHRPDSLTFTVPGLVGLSLLAGLGAASRSPRSPRRLLYIAACFIAPVFLLITNYPLVNRSTMEEYRWIRWVDKTAAAPFPPHTVFIGAYGPAMPYRYLYYIQAGRTDIKVLVGNEEETPLLVKHFAKSDEAVFIILSRDPNSMQDQSGGTSQ
jgi:hypothetical protein